MRKIYVKPAPGLLIRDPVLGDHIEPDGREVEQSDYWIRRLRDGDVTEEPQPPVAEQPAA